MKFKIGERVTYVGWRNKGVGVVYPPVGCAGKVVDVDKWALCPYKVEWPDWYTDYPFCWCMKEELESETNGH